jgi:RND family efflux transporter MFP subunit
MKRILCCAFFSFCLLSCGHADGGGDTKSDSAPKNAGQENSGSSPDRKSGDKASRASGQMQVTINGAAQKKAGIQVAQLQSAEVPEYLTASGQIVMNEERTAHIGTYTDGRVTELKANIGDVVRRGMVLARMHSHDVHETRAAYETALEGVIRQKTMVAYDQRMRDRMMRLFDLKSASRQEVEKAESDLKSAQTDLANAQISVDKEVAHLTDILNLPASALPDINESTEQVPVVSTLNGVVIDRKVSLGSVVEPGEEVFTVSDLNSVWMIASLNESDIGKVRVGNKASILSPAYPDQAFTGQVTRLGTELDPKTRTLLVRIVVPNPGMKLRSGMYVNAQLMQGMSRSAIFVPEEAIQEINGGSFVFTRRSNNVFEATPVQIAHHLNGQAQISAGLVPGDALVVKGSFVVKSEMLKSQIGE